MSPGTGLPYGWGKFQAWVCFFAGVFIAASKRTEYPYPLNVVLAVVAFFIWYGLWRKHPYGFWLVYVMAIANVVIGTFVLLFDQNVDTIVSMVMGCAFWVIPAIRYYPQRYGEFAWEDRAKGTAEPQRKPEPEAKAQAVAAIGSPEPPAGVRRVSYEEWREAVARYRVGRIRKSKQQEPRQ